MNCQRCGSQLNMDGTCPACGQGNVRIMEKSEINAYDGITIEANSNENEDSYRGNSYNSYERVGGAGGPRIIRFSSGGTLTKVLFGVAAALLLAGLVFVALPLMVLAVVVGLAIYMIYSFLT